MRFSLLLILLVSLLLPAQPAAAQSGERCFPETGFCIKGPIRTYWERNGGLPVFGFPKGPQTTESVEGVVLTIQWFERDRLEIQPNGLVTAGRLGAQVLEMQGTPWQFGNGAAANSGCTAFRETGHQVCGAFRQYWQRFGGLERFGFPITGEFTAVLDGKTMNIQWFERRRFEWHADINNGTVLLGLLGNEVLAARNGGTPAPAAPAQPAAAVPTGQVSSNAPSGDRSSGQCSAAAAAGGVPNAPIRIADVDKQRETVTLSNVGGGAVDVSGWYICSQTGNQLHAVLQGVFAPGETVTVGRDAQAYIWNNSSSDPAFLANAQGVIVAYLPD
jgi:hypothetical protein